MPRAIESVRPDNSGRYIDGDERDGYADRAMKLLSVNHERQARYGPRWVVQAVMIDSGEKVAISLADNATRSTMFGQVREDLEADGSDAYEPVCLYRQSREGGNAFWTFRSATPDEIATAETSEALPDVATIENADMDDEPAETPRRPRR
jgi:hypothetical protein